VRPHRRVRGVALSLLLDRVASEVVGAIEERGAAAFVVKGPVFARWLYPGELRTYGDVDIIVAGSDLAIAEAAMRELGFTRHREEVLGAAGVPRHHAWQRPSDGAWVDLDTTIPGLEADASAVWDALNEDAETVLVGGRSMRTPGVAARLLHVAVHAAQHGRGIPKPIEDVRRAIDRAPVREWQAAARLAERLESAGAFAAGLALVPEGRVLAQELGVSDATTASDRLRAESAPTTAFGIERLTREPTLRGKLSLVRSEAWPSREFLVWWRPGLAGRRGGIAVTRAYRLAWLAVQVPRGLVAWLRARRH
jgi:hypothetical protein